MKPPFNEAVFLLAAHNKIAFGVFCFANADFERVGAIGEESRLALELIS